MPTQTGSIDFKSTKGLQSYASGQYATLTQVKGQFATCSTAAGTQAKAATIVPSDTGWALYTGATITVKFTADNTHATPTLNVNSTGAKSIRDHTGAALTEEAYKWKAGDALAFTYDGTYWRMQDTLAQRVTTNKTAIEQNASNILLRATKTEASQMAQPNLAPIGSMPMSDVYNADTNPSGYWKATTTWFTNLDDGWVRCYRDNTDGTSATNATGWRPSPSPSVEAGKVYTILTEIRNNNSSGSSQTDMYLQQIANNQFWGDINGATIDDDHVTTTTNISLRTCGETYVRYSYRIADTEHLTTDPVELFRYNFRLPAGGKFDFEFRQSVYEGIYDGPYKPYAGSQLYASQAELKVASDAIDLKVSKNDVINQINVSTEGITIDADRVNITGAAIFTTGRLSESSLNSTYDANGAAATVQTNLDNLQVGGRNLLTDSADISKCFDHINKVTSIVGGYADPDGGTNAYLITPNATTWYAGPASSRLLLTRLSVSYTFSIWLRADNATQCNLCCRYMDATPYSSTAHRKTVDVTTEWQRFYISAPLKQAQTADSIWIGQVTTEPIYAFHPMVEMSSTPSDWSPAPEDQEASVNSARTWYAECPTAAATAAKVATITPATTEFKLEKGVSVSVKFTYANTVASPTLNVNGTGAIAIMRYGSTAPSTSAATSWQANSVNTLTYDGSNWRLNNWLNDNTTYNLGRNLHATAVKVLEAVASGLLMAGTASGYKKIAAGVSFSLSYPLLYASAAYTANTTYTNTYETWNSVTYSSTSAIQSGAANKTIYLKGSVSANTFTIDSTNVFTTVEPTSEDGRFYIPLGIMSSATVGNFATSNSLYAYIDGKFRQVTPTEIVATHRVYYRTATADSSLAAPDSWVEEAAGNVYNAWTTKVPPLASSTSAGQTKYLFLYTCEQRKRLDGTVECTKVLLDENTTVIDGGTIITGTVNANAVNASSGTFAEANIPNLNASKITAGTLNIGQIPDAAKNDNIQVGVRNLLLGTAGEKQLTTTASDTNKCAYYILSDYGYSAVHGSVTTLMVSFDWETTGTGGTIRVQPNGSPWSSASVVTVSSTNQSGHVDHTFSVPSTWASATFTGYGVRFDNIDGTTTVSNFIMQVGNKAIGWTPAPEDQTTYVNETANRLGGDISSLSDSVGGQIEGLGGRLDESDENIASLRSSIEADRQLRDNWIRMDEAGIFVGSNTSAYGVGIDADSVDFMVGGERAAYASAEAFVPKALRLGDYVLSGSGGYLFIDYSPLT